MYFGTEEQKRLQRKSDDMTAWVMETPGACLTGRGLAFDDFDAIGWETVRAHLIENGHVAFRWMNPSQVQTIRETVADLGAKVFEWGGYEGDSKNLLEACCANLKRPMPTGLSLHQVDEQTLPDLQAFLSKCGISPLSGRVMLGQICPGLSSVLKDPNGRILAAGFAGMLQNRFSRLHDAAWIGLIAVCPSRRGEGLGKIVTSSVICDALKKFDANRVVGFAADENAASIAMLKAVGLSRRSEVSCIATLSSERHTR